jgi:hypothetical protein
VFITFFLLSLTGRIFAIKIDLNPGWNLITVPVDSELPVREFLSEHLFFGDIPIHNIDSAVKRIWGYHGKWVSYSNDSGDLTHFKPNRGYWFYMSQATTLRIDEKSFSLQPLELNGPGWSLIGFGNKEPLSFKEHVFSDNSVISNHLPQNILKVYGYKNKWESFQTVPEMSGEAKNLNPGQGYWFYVRDRNEYKVSVNRPLRLLPQKSDTENMAYSFQTLYHNRTKEESETANPLKRGRIGHKILLNTE